MSDEAARSGPTPTSALAGTFEAKWAHVPAPRHPLDSSADGVERWQPVPIAPGYEVSSFGRARSLDQFVPVVNTSDRFRRGKILAIDWDDLGYGRVSLGRFVRNALISRLVAMAFHGMPAAEDAVVRHIDGNPRNNRPDNLIWGTQEENIHDTMRHGRHWTFYVERCPRGHDLVEPNLVKAQLAKGRRDCRACNAARAAIWQLEKRGLPAPTFQELSDEKFAKFMKQKPRAA